MGRMDSAGHFAMIPPLRTLTILAWLLYAFAQAFHCVFSFARYTYVYLLSTTAESRTSIYSWLMVHYLAGAYFVVTVSMQDRALWLGESFSWWHC